MKRNGTNRLLALFLFLILAAGIAYPYPGKAAPTYDEADFQSWFADWQIADFFDSGKIVLNPGSGEADLNLAWYSETGGTPAVMVSKNKLYTQSKTFRGKAKEINRTNGYITYVSANHVTINDYFTEPATYYYRYTDDISATTVEWSKTYTYTKRNTDSFSAVLVGDAQIGASENIAADTYNWNRTLTQAVKTAPEASLLLSTGDQINYKTNTGDDGLRESQYAGFLYPSALRSLPVAAAIGNHETKGSDYRYHFNNPNSEEQLGSTPSGCDYYFRHGAVLFIVLNSNSRDTGSHRSLMKQAISEHKDATWRIVLFHHDIYGSGAAHSGRTSANMRILFAPLMDEFKIDLVLTGHDHSYARSYPMLDGTAITEDSTALLNPVGTTYISLGSSSCSKVYELASPKQYYVAERSNIPLPTYSVLHADKNTLKIETYDYNGKKYAEDFSITKTAAKINPLAKLKTALAKKKAAYTTASYNQLKKAITKMKKRIKPSATDKGAKKVSKYYGKSNDPLSYYGYAAGTQTALPKGFSTLLDKTRISCVRVKPESLSAAYQALKQSLSNLEKTTLTVRRGRKKCKNNAVLKLKKGKTIRLKVSKSPARYKLTYKSYAKKYVSVSKNGVIRAKKKREKAVPVTVKFQNRSLRLYIRVI